MAYQPDTAQHPGQTISKILKKEGISQKELSDRTSLTQKHISQIINGEASITMETALMLENVLGGSASFWINLEKNYQETKARIERVSKMALDKYGKLEVRKHTDRKPSCLKARRKPHGTVWPSHLGT